MSCSFHLLCDFFVIKHHKHFTKFKCKHLVSCNCMYVVHISPLYNMYKITSKVGCMGDVQGCGHTPRKANLKKTQEKGREKTKLTTITTMCFTNGSKLIGFEEVTPHPNFSEVCTHTHPNTHKKKLIRPFQKLSMFIQYRYLIILLC